MKLLQWGLEYQTLEYRTHWNTKHYVGQIYNGLNLECLVIAIAMALTIPIRNHWKSKENSQHFVQNRTPLENQMQWKTEQRATTGIPNVFDIKTCSVFQPPL